MEHSEFDQTPQERRPWRYRSTLALKLACTGTDGFASVAPVDASGDWHVLVLQSEPSLHQPAAVRWKRSIQDC